MARRPRPQLPVRRTRHQRAAAGAARGRAGSAIVNISSGSAILPSPPLAHYAAAKAALNTYGKALAAELAPAGIRVTTIMPGNVLAPGADAIRQNFADAMGVELAATTAGVPLGRPGDPRDIAETVAFLRLRPSPVDHRRQPERRRRRASRHLTPDPVGRAGLERGRAHEAPALRAAGRRGSWRSR
ncbi:SDR family oxidoreductase [Actinoplanes awajinensis]|uniref:SDR family oxidoreductase n=1 Tax=Actinoplanes awajinensis TaxID=135946 RepID=UPI000A9E241B|nr:SDR family oxidoreductase [Actinoplanes awajinensis]